VTSHTMAVRPWNLRPGDLVEVNKDQSAAIYEVTAHPTDCGRGRLSRSRVYEVSARLVSYSRTAQNYVFWLATDSLRYPADSHVAVDAAAHRLAVSHDWVPA
jgi:hypothetical protein